jgi:glycosyltransferase involved in cell wall biosynthesis
MFLIVYSILSVEPLIPSLTTIRRITSPKMALALSKVRTTETLRIAVVAPLYYTIPPIKYGGTERVVAYLVEEFVSMGHTVDLYGAKGCKTKANLIECSPITLEAAGIGGTIAEMQAPYTLQLKRLLADLTKYDVVSIHHGILPFHPGIFTKPGPFVWTDHTELHVENKGETLQKLYEHANAGATSISKSQRSILTGADYWLGNIYHGLPKYLLAPITSVKPTYLGFLGRLSPEKGAPEAVRIAVMAGMQLHVAAKIESIHLEYYKREVKPVFEQHDVVYIGEIDDKSKSEFLSGAVALIFPIQWNEPFGLVMIEAMACGTPVVAYNKGAAPEVIEEGVTGFVVNTAEEAAAKVKEAAKLDRKRIRAEFEKRWTSATMAEGYLELFHRIKNGKAWDSGTADGANSSAKGASDLDGDIDDIDTEEHICPGHHHCAAARAAKLESHTESNDSGNATNTATDNVVSNSAGLQAGEICTAR